MIKGIPKFVELYDGFVCLTDMIYKAKPYHIIYAKFNKTSKFPYKFLIGIKPYQFRIKKIISNILLNIFGLIKPAL